MKRNIYLFLLLTTLGFITSCKDLDYKKSSSGLMYKIIDKSGPADSLAREGSVVKLHFIRKWNDSVLQDSYGKMPFFTKVGSGPAIAYSPMEVIPMMRKGDSAVTVELVDTLLNKGLASQLPPTAKKGDKITTMFTILEVFTNDSLARLDYEAEMARDKPRQDKEMAEQMAKEEKERKEQIEKEEAELRSSGEIDRELKAMEAYLAAKKIPAVKTGKGTYVHIKQQGTGPAADSGTAVTVKYSGRKLVNDSVFEASSYSFIIGTSTVIAGWDEGLKLFKQGGKGTLYIPGFLAYGKNPRPGSPFGPFEALIFDVELTEVKK